MGNPSPVSSRVDRTIDHSEKTKEVKVMRAILPWTREENLGAVYLHGKRRPDTVASEIVDGCLNIEANLTGRAINFGYWSDRPDLFQEIQPTEDDRVVIAPRPLETMVRDHQWPTVETGYLPDRPYYEWAKIALEPDGTLNPKFSIHEHRLGFAYLVNLEDAIEGIRYGRLDLIPVTKDELKIVNCTDLPISIDTPDWTYEDYCNPDVNMPHPAIAVDNEADEIYAYELHNVPPQLDGVVYAVRLEVAILAHALGRYDFVAVGAL